MGSPFPASEAGFASTYGAQSWTSASGSFATISVGHASAGSESVAIKRPPAIDVSCPSGRSTRGIRQLQPDGSHAAVDDQPSVSSNH